MKCLGAGQPPRNLYKAVHHYRLRSGKMHQSSGWGSCAHCGGAHCVRADKNGIARVVHHKPLSDCTPAIQAENRGRHERWRIYARMNHVQGAPTTATFGGQIGQYFNVVETTPSVTYSTVNRFRGYAQTYTAPTTFRVELQSTTRNTAGDWVFNINDQIYVSPSDRMTMAVDYVSWNNWNNSITTSNYARIELNQTWGNWITPPTPIYGNQYQAIQRPVAPIEQRLGVPGYTRPREDPVAARERRQREAEALFQRVEAESVSRAEAKARAEQTLLMLLTPEQRREYKERRQFHVRGSKGTLYRILHGSSGNVRQVLSEADEGRGLHAFCAHPRMRVDGDSELGIAGGVLPHEDAMIAQMLALMADEDQFLAVANRHW